MRSGRPRQQAPEMGVLSVQRSGVVPSLAERLDEIRHRRAPDLGLDVVPRWVIAVHTVQPLGLRISAVALVVTAPVAQIDAPNERDVVGGTIAVQRGHELLVVRASASDAL